MSKEDRTEYKNLKIPFPDLVGQISSVPEFTEDELREALKNMRPKEASRPDDISPPLVKNLGTNAIKLRCHMFNISLTTGNIPKVWRNTNILINIYPYESHHLILDLLDQCVGKLLER